MRASQRPNHDVFEHRHLRRRLLPGPRHSQMADLVRLKPVQKLALESDHAPRRRVIAGDAIEERGLAGAVGPDQSQHHAFIHAERNVGVGRETTEELTHMLKFEDRHHATSAFFCLKSCFKYPSTPSGMNRITTTTITP